MLEVLLFYFSLQQQRGINYCLINCLVPRLVDEAHEIKLCRFCNSAEFTVPM